MKFSAKLGCEPNNKTLRHKYIVSLNIRNKTFRKNTVTGWIWKFSRSQQTATRRCPSWPAIPTCCSTGPLPSRMRMDLILTRAGLRPRHILFRDAGHSVSPDVMFQIKITFEFSVIKKFNLYRSSWPWKPLSTTW